MLAHAQMTGQRQSVPARHGIATFVPKGHSIKVINTYGSQVISTWVFALHKPPTEESEAEERAAEEAFNQVQQEAEREVNAQLQQPAAVDVQPGENTSDVVVVDKHEELAGDEKMPSKDEAQTTVDTEAPAIPTAKPTIQTVNGKKVRSWSSYVPSVPSVSALRYRSKASAAQASKDAPKISEEQGEGSSKDNAELKPEELNKDGTESKETDKVEAVESEVSDHAAQADDEGVKVAGTTTPSDKSEDDYTDAKSVQSSRSWGSYLPSIRARAKAAYGMDPKAGTGDKQEKGSQRTWLSYLPSGASFTSYLPSNSKDALSAFASSHHRDPTKSYAEQLYEFSKTPVGAASLSAATGSGTAGSLYAAYSAYTKLQAAQRRTEPMEYLSLPHTIDALQKLSPEPGDTLISNLHEPLLTLLEDTSPPTTTAADSSSSSSSAAASIPLRHGTILPACDPTTYKNLAGPDAKGEEHGSCAENLVLALQEFNKSTGLKGPRTVGADVTLNSAPVPLSLFMNTSVRQQQQEQQQKSGSSSGSGNVVVEEPRKFEGGKWGKGGEKGGWVKFRAERDVVVIMSACPMDVGPTNAGRCMAANFVVEEPVCEEKVVEEEEEGEKGEEKGKEKAKVQTTSEQINGKKVEAKKAQVKKEVKKPAATPAAAASATPVPEVKGKRRDSAHGIAEGAQPKVKKTPAEDRAKSPIENTAKAAVGNKTKTPVECRAKTPVENRAKTPMENRAKTPVENRAKSPVERVKSPFGNIVRNPFENRAKSPVSGVQSPRTGASTPCSEAIRNMPRPGKKKPKKLERRSSSKAPA